MQMAIGEKMVPHSYFFKAIHKRRPRIAVCVRHYENSWMLIEYWR